MTPKSKTILSFVAATILILVVASSTMSSKAFAKIEEVTRCDGEVDPDGCPGRSSGPGQGHEETTQNENPAGHTPGGLN
jgi:hypothetical protein